MAVYTSTQYLLGGCDLDEQTAERIGSGYLANDLIQRFEFKSAAQWAQDPGFEAKAAKVTGQAVDTVNTVNLLGMDDDELMAFSRDNVLALSLVEMQKIRDHFADPDVRAARETVGLAEHPTDAELEVLAQTWSEHCKHKIFNARIDYDNRETGTRRTVDSLFSTYIAGSTKAIRAAKGARTTCACPCSRTMRASSGSTMSTACASRWRPTTAPRPWTPTAEP